MSNKKNVRIKTELLVHDLKNPLAIIEAGALSLINRQDKYGILDEKQLKVLNRILRSSKLAMGLVNDMLEIGKSCEGVFNKRKFFISDLIKKTLVEIFDLTDHDTADSIKKSTSLNELKKILSDKDILLKVEEMAWQHAVDLDESKIAQILRNLLHNAIKFRSKIIELGLEIDEKDLVLLVSDDGMGIKKSDQEKIFECYFQLNAGEDFTIRGHGLGLAGVLILVEDMGGKLTIDSDKYDGARFFVKIPL
ncbi:MAG: HAMP domain-containing histidine kinase [Deltaproteobacteria bacterium]|nr:HAMP domain-containing histidine kinase [Deltaproteobacteria bacterium]